MKTIRIFLIAVLVLVAPALRAADGSLSFDGTDDYVEVPNFHTLGVTTEVTVEFWAKTDTAKQQSAFMLSPDDALNRFQAHLNYSNGFTYWDFGDIGNGGRVSVANPAGTLGNWTHYALVGSATGNFMKIYVNGVEAATVSSFNAFEIATACALRIGGSTSYFYDGSLDDFRIWNVARTQAEIARDLGGPLTGSEPGLRLYLKFDEGTGTTTANSATATGAAFNGTLVNGPVWSAPARTTYTVTTANDTGAGSLRQAITDAAAASGPALITFAPGLSGGTITLNSEIVINDAGVVTIDATSLPGGLTITDTGNVTYRLVSVASGSSLMVRGLTFANGGGNTFSANGGAISNSGTLLAEACTFSGNTLGNSGGQRGGAIFSTGALTLLRCTFTGNVAYEGGALRSQSSACTITNCTFSANTAVIGGACSIADGGPAAALTHVTITGNTSTGAPAVLSGSGGGGVFLFAKTITFTNCLIAGNTSPFGPDLQNKSTPAPTSGGGNLIGNNTGLSWTALGSDIIGTGAAPVNPLLGALGNNGGVTQTIPPLTGSPAINAALGLSGLTTDQRGFSRDATPTIGAYEFDGVDPAALRVTTLADSGAGSLREAVANAALVAGPQTITFASALAGQAVELSTNLAIPAAGDPSTVTLATATDSGAVDIGVNAGTLSFGVGGGSWTGTGRILLGSTSGTAPATVTLAGATTLNAPIVVRPGSSGEKKLVSTHASGDAIFAGSVTLNDAATVQQAASGTLNFTGDVNLGAHTLSVSYTSRIFFEGRVYRNDGVGRALLRIVSGPSFPSDSEAVFLRGTGSNDRLAAEVSGGRIAFDKAGFALGLGLTPADGPALSFTGGGTGASFYSSDAVATTASVSLGGQISFYGGQTFGAANGGGVFESLIGSGVVLGAGNANGTLGGDWRNSISITKIGTGTVTLTGSGEHPVGTTGSLNVSAGVLNVTGSYSKMSGASVASGATLAGTGTVTALTLNAGGTIAPGSATTPGSIGTLNVGASVARNLTWNAGGVMKFHLGSGATSDRVAITGALTKSGSGTFAFDFQGTGTPGQLYTLATFASTNFVPSDFIAQNMPGSPVGLAGTFRIVGGNTLQFIMGVPPTVTISPTSTTVTAGAAVIFTATPDEAGLTFQWLKNGVAIAGATQSTLTLNPVTADNGAVFTVRATRPLDGTSSVSNPATVTVTPGSATSFTVSSAGANGTGSLFEAASMAIASTAAGAKTITFAPALAGQTLPLTQEIVVPTGTTLVIDGTGLITPPRIDGGGVTRLFSVGTSANLTLQLVTLANGRGGDGGAVLNAGTTTLISCTLSNNGAGNGGDVTGSGNQGGRGKQGGAIFTSGTLVMTKCTAEGNFAGNGGWNTDPAALGPRGGHGGHGGAVYVSSGTATLTSCTFSNNRAGSGGTVVNTSATTSVNGLGGSGGAVGNSATLTVISCTFLGNRSGSTPSAAQQTFGPSARAGYGIYNAGTLSLRDTILWNSDAFFGDVATTGATTLIGANIIFSLSTFPPSDDLIGGTGSVTGPAFTSTNPLLAPLGNYGGPTRTMALLPGSPARNAAPGSAITSDQRGCPIVGTPDIGAYEAGSQLATVYNAFIWESLPTAGNGTISDPLHASGFDFDRDGVTNGNEWLALTNAADPTSYLRILTATRTGDDLNVSFPTVVGRNYSFEFTTALSPAPVWTPIPGSIAGNGAVQAHPIGPFTGQPRVFIRVRVGP